MKKHCNTHVLQWSGVVLRCHKDILRKWALWHCNKYTQCRSLGANTWTTVWQVCCGDVSCRIAVDVGCSVLPCAAVCCRVLPCAAVCCCVLQCATVCRSVLQCAAVCCSVLKCAAVWHCVALCAVVWFSVLQFVRVDIGPCVLPCVTVSALPCVTVSALPCVAVSALRWGAYDLSAPLQHRSLLQNSPIKEIIYCKRVLHFQRAY